MSDGTIGLAWSKFGPNIIEILVPNRLLMGSWLGIDASTIMCVIIQCYVVLWLFNEDVNSIMQSHLCSVTSE